MMATEAAELSPAELSELEGQIKAQGDEVRAAKEALKAGTGEKSTVDSAVAALLELKGKLPASLGGKGGGKKAKQHKSKKQRKEDRHGQGPAPYGVDTLRLWVAMSDWKVDIAVGETVLSKSRESYRRLRNSCRFILGNLTDFDAAVDSVSLDAMRMGDRHMLHRLAEFAAVAESAHDAHAMNRVVTTALTLATESLSGRYFDATKDRLYCGARDGASRRAVQTVLHSTLDTLLLALAPIVPFLAEEVHAYRNEPRPAPPIERTWEAPPAEWLDEALSRRYAFAYAVNDELARLVHDAQQQKRLKGATDAMAEVVVVEGSELHAALEALGGELNDVLGVCATRLTVRSAAEAAEAATQAAKEAAEAATQAAKEEVQQAAGEGAAEEVVASLECNVLEKLTASEQVEPGHGQIRLELRATATQRCDRCWRYVPLEVAEKGVEGVSVGGWLYSGCPRDGESVLCFAEGVRK